MLCVIQLLEGNCPISNWRVGGRESPSPPPGLASLREPPSTIISLKPHLFHWRQAAHRGRKSIDITLCVTDCPDLALIQCNALQWCHFYNDFEPPVPHLIAKIVNYT